MDTLDAKLLAERARLVALLSGLANALGGQPAERLADILPGLHGIDDLIRQARRLGLTIPATYPEGAPSLTGPLGGASILRDGLPRCPLCDAPTAPEAFMLPAIVLGSDPGVPEAMCPSCAALRPKERSALRTQAMTRRLQRDDD